VPLAKYTALLCLFAVAAYRDVQLAFLTVALLAEVSSAVHVAAKMAGLAGGWRGAGGRAAAARAGPWPAAGQGPLRLLLGLGAACALQLLSCAAAHAGPHTSTLRSLPAGVPTDSPARQRLQLAEKGALVAFRLVPHALIGLVVAFSPRAFSSLLYWLLALAAMVVCNVVNLRKGSRMLLQQVPPAGKAHAE
jgi:hypothetical protein